MSERQVNPKFNDDGEPLNRAARRYASFGDPKPKTYKSSGPSAKAAERAQRKAA